MTEIQTSGRLEKNHARIKPSDVEAAVAALRITETEAYGELAEARKSELWKGIFGVEKPDA